MIMEGLKTGLACLLSIALVGCGEPAPTPPGVQYSVIKDESTPRKRVVEVVLAERVDQATLEQLARELKKSNSAELRADVHRLAYQRRRARCLLGQN